MSTRSSGFTLVEILVALAVGGLVLTIVAEGFRLGLRGISGYAHSIQFQSDMVPIERALRHMMERMDPGIYPEPPLAKGTAHSFVFTSELPDPANGGTLTADLRLEVDRGRLVLWWTPHTRGVPFGAPPQPSRQVLLDGVERLDISYAARGRSANWQTTWTADVLPTLVSLRIIPVNGENAWPPIVAHPPREPTEE